jgi:hypothetical protein
MRCELQTDRLEWSREFDLSVGGGRAALLCQDRRVQRPGTDTPRLSGAANAANGREGFRPNDSAIAAEAPLASRSARPAITSSTDPALPDRGVNTGDAVPTSPEGRRIAITPLDALWVSPRGASSSRAARLRSALRRSGRLRCLRRQDFFRRGRSNRALVRSIDCRHEAALAQPRQRGACRVRKPARHNDQFGDARAAILPKPFDDLRQLRPAPRRG